MDDTFRARRAALNNYFAYYRFGGIGTATRPWEDPTRPRRVPMDPRPGKWSGVYVADLIGIPRLLKLQGAKRKDYKARAVVSKEVAKVHGNAVKIAKHLRSQGLNINLIRVLGVGGNGIASLFEFTGRYGGKKKLVIKSCARPGSDMEEEQSITRVS